MCKSMYWLVCAMLGILVCAHICPAQPENLVQNGSFEEDEDLFNGPGWWEWHPSQGNGSTLDFDDSQAAFGKRSVRLEPNGSGTGWHFQFVYSPLSFIVGVDYTVSYWAKAAVERPIRVQFKAADNSSSWGGTTSDLTTEWAEYHLTAPAGNATVKLEFHLNQSADVLWLDHVSVYEGEFVEGLVPVVRVNSVDPQPGDGATVNDTAVTLSWNPGLLTASNTVYLGTDYNDVLAATPDSELLIAQDVLDATLVLEQPLDPGIMYYWRVDDVNDNEPNSPWQSDVWSFFIPPLSAYDPMPASTTEYVLDDTVLSWQPGLGALLHTVYFGTDPEEVANDTGGALQNVTTFTPEALELGTTYYWRVDEFGNSGLVKGEVWSFTTVPGDIPPAADADLLGHWTFDQVSAGSAVDWSGNGLHGRIVGDPQWVPGVADMAIELDGSDAFVTDAPENLSSNTLTFTAWVNPAQVHSWTGLLFTRGSGATCGINFKSDNQLSYHWPGGDIGAWAFNTNLVVPMYQWSFVALVVEPTKATFYLNGQDLWATNEGEHRVVDITNPLNIGRDPQGGRLLTGQLDDVRLYSRALTGDEIDAVMAAGTVPPEVEDPFMVDDFEGYRAYMSETEPNVWDVWIDGYDDNNNGSQSGYLDPPLMERVVTVNGGQSLPLLYSNLGGGVSTVTRSFAPALDLTADGATALVLYVYGDANNDATISSDQVVLTLKSGSQSQEFEILSSVDIAKPKWHEIRIELNDLTIDKSQINEISISVGTAGSVGGSGIIYVDNIQKTL